MEKKQMFVLSSSLRIPDPYLHFERPDPFLLLGNPRLLIHLPRNWLCHHLLKRLSFPILYSCFLCQRLINHRYLDFSSGLSILFHWSICFVFVPIPHCFDYCKLCSIVWNLGGLCLLLCSFSQGYFGNSASFMVPHKFYDYLYHFSEKFHW